MQTQISPVNLLVALYNDENLEFLRKLLTFTSQIEKKTSINVHLVFYNMENKETSSFSFGEITLEDKMLVEERIRQFPEQKILTSSDHAKYKSENYYITRFDTYYIGCTGYSFEGNQAICLVFTRYMYFLLDQEKHNFPEGKYSIFKTNWITKELYTLLEDQKAE